MALSKSEFEDWRAEIGGTWAATRNQLEKSAADGSLRRRDLPGYLLPCVAAGDAKHADWIMRLLYPNAARTSPLALSPSDTLRNWCRANGAACEIVIPAQHVAIAKTTPYTCSYDYTTEDAVFAALPMAAWVPGWDYVIANDGTVMADSGYLPITNRNVGRPHFNYAGPGAVIHYAPHTREMIAGDTLFLSGPLDGHIGHWMIDFLPRLKGRSHSDRPLKIAVPDNLTVKQRETLRLFGVRDQDLILGDDGRTYIFERLHIYRPGLSMPPNPAHVQYVRDHLPAPSQRPTPGKRVFLARGHIGTRLVANDAALQAVLADFGFIQADMADYSFAAQSTLLKDAEILMGAFGSNLLALYLAPPGCTVIELADNTHEDPTIPHTCSFLNQRHQFLVCEIAGPSAIQRHRKDRDIVVDCDELRRRLLEIEALTFSRDAP